MKFLDSITPANVITIIVISASALMGFTHLSDEVEFSKRDISRIDALSMRNNDRIHAVEINVSAILNQLKENGKKLDQILNKEN